MKSTKEMLGVLPGTYIRVSGEWEPTPAYNGIIGVVALPATLSWLTEEEVITVTRSEWLNGSSREKIGISSADAVNAEPESLARKLNLVFENAIEVILYPMNTGATPAAATIVLEEGGEGEEDRELSVVAVKSGTFGNSITIKIDAVADDVGEYVVSTIIGGIKVDRQTVATAEELVANDYVTFTGTGALAANAGTVLSGATDGTPAEDYINAMTEKIAGMSFNVITNGTDNAADNTALANFVISEYEKEDEGNFYRAVINDTADVNHWLVSMMNQGVELASGTEYSATEVIYWLAGYLAAARPESQITYAVLPNAVRAIPEYSKAKQIERIQNGRMSLIKRVNNDIVIQSDKTSFTTPTQEFPPEYKSNSVIIALQMTYNYTKFINEVFYIGAEPNIPSTHDRIRARLVGWIQDNLVGTGVLEDFDAETDIEIEAVDGQPDAILIDIYYRFNGRIERIGVTVIVQSAYGTL